MEELWGALSQLLALKSVEEKTDAEQDEEVVEGEADHGRPSWFAGSRTRLRKAAHELWWQAPRSCANHHVLTPSIQRIPCSPRVMDFVMTCRCGARQTAKIWYEAVCREEDTLWNAREDCARHLGRFCDDTSRQHPLRTSKARNSDQRNSFDPP